MKHKTIKINSQTLSTLGTLYMFRTYGAWFHGLLHYYKGFVPSGQFISKASFRDSLCQRHPSGTIDNLLFVINNFIHFKFLGTLGTFYSLIF